MPWCGGEAGATVLRGEGGKAGSRLTHLARIGGGEWPCRGLRWMHALGRRVGGRRRDGSKSENIGGCIY